ncbi:hypothetical protein ABID56_000931 [Alkalibacillus flavidus]|uniref:Permuted papain-like amidase enzyme, YaeF/YiiX, C92 family n=1 Tax=Alkalibacillus flavidus TaxID=546021 RepID=A0ABV2KW94_9BACI
MTSYPTINGVRLKAIDLFQGGTLLASYPPQDEHVREATESLALVGTFDDGSQQTFTLPVATRRPSDFKPGDILVASDNYGDVYPPGYIGHSAIVIDDSHLIEAVTSYPQVRRAPIDNFLSIHTQVMHARPKDPRLGAAAADYAKEYLRAYTSNLNQDKAVPEFSFTTSVPLNDPNDAIYCSKLVWLSYYYGADVMFDNNFFLFAPVDLEANLENDDRFDVLYKHPEFDFKISLKL